MRFSKNRWLKRKEAKQLALLIKDVVSKTDFWGFYSFELFEDGGKVYIKYDFGNRKTYVEDVLNVKKHGEMLPMLVNRVIQYVNSVVPYPVKNIKVPKDFKPARAAYSPSEIEPGSVELWYEKKIYEY